ncbi:DUF6760 family protein [Kitasatospora sp. NPDC058048]|uniref:DUF6760 family protein n=1 Tax=Kitasatospora sp. NPDC058048 TaxID=3346313 RepID=UPI0036D9EDC4
MTPPPEHLREEVAYLAYYLHWGLEDLLHMEHEVRRQYVREVARMNTRINRGSGYGWPG